MLQSWLGEIVKVDRMAQGTTLVTKEYKLESVGELHPHWKQATKFLTFEPFHCNSQTWKTVAYEVVALLH